MGRCSGRHQAGAERVYYTAIEFDVPKSEPSFAGGSESPHWLAGADALAGLAMVSVRWSRSLAMMIPGRGSIDGTGMQPLNSGSRNTRSNQSQCKSDPSATTQQRQHAPNIGSMSVERKYD